MSFWIFVVFIDCLAGFPSLAPCSEAVAGSVAFAGENRDRRTFIRFLRHRPELHQQIPFWDVPESHVSSIDRRVLPVVR
jgi:hypothetical protein